MLYPFMSYAFKIIIPVYVLQQLECQCHFICILWLEGFNVYLIHSSEYIDAAVWLLSQQAASRPTPLTPIASTPMPAVTPAAATTIPTSERELAALEDTKNSLKELQEEFSVYRREKSENER